MPSGIFNTLGNIGIQLQLPVLLLMFLLLLRNPRTEFSSLRNTVLLYFAGLAGLLAAAPMMRFGWVDSGEITRQVSILLIGLTLIRLGGMTLFRVLLPGTGLEPPSILEDLVVFVAYIIWGMVRLSYIGLELSSIVTTSAVITAVLAFSMQDTLGNILGGMALQLDDSIHVGDWIQVDDVVGRIVDIRWRSTSVETRNWETVVIPNSMLMKTKFRILGRRIDQDTQWRRWIWFNVGFEVSPRRVMRVVEEALSRANVPAVASDPPPNCVTMDISDSYVRYAVRYWLTDLFVDDPTDSAIRSRIHAALKRANIPFALPTQSMHMIKKGEKLETREKVRNIHHRVETMRRVALFSSLSAEELEKVAENLSFAPFVAGDVVTPQGAIAHWLYILVDGSVEVVLDTESGQRRSLARIDAGGRDSVFGEMGLLTGAPRSASVVALTDVECYRLDTAGFEAVLHARPAIADEISHIISAREANLSAARDDLDQQARARLHENQHQELRTRIRRFFGLDP